MNISDQLISAIHYRPALAYVYSDVLGSVALGPPSVIVEVYQDGVTLPHIYPLSSAPHHLFSCRLKVARSTEDPSCPPRNSSIASLHSLPISPSQKYHRYHSKTSQMQAPPSQRNYSKPVENSEYSPSTFETPAQESNYSKMQRR